MCFQGDLSLIIMKTNVKLHTFFQAMLDVQGGGHQIRTLTDKGGGNLTFCRTSFVNGPSKYKFVIFFQFGHIRKKIHSKIHCTHSER